MRMEYTDERTMHWLLEQDFPPYQDDRSDQEIPCMMCTGRGRHGKPRMDELRLPKGVLAAMKADVLRSQTTGPSESVHPKRSLAKGRAQVLRERAMKLSRPGTAHLQEGVPSSLSASVGPKSTSTNFSDASSQSSTCASNTQPPSWTQAVDVLNSGVSFAPSKNSCVKRHKLSQQDSLSHNQTKESHGNQESHSQYHDNQIVNSSHPGVTAGTKNTLISDNRSVSSTRSGGFGKLHMHSKPLDKSGAGTLSNPSVTTGNHARDWGRRDKLTLDDKMAHTGNWINNDRISLNDRMTDAGNRANHDKVTLSDKMADAEEDFPTLPSKPQLEHCVSEPNMTVNQDNKVIPSSCTSPPERTNDSSRHGSLEAEAEYCDQDTVSLDRSASLASDGNPEDLQVEETNTDSVHSDTPDKQDNQDHVMDEDDEPILPKRRPTTLNEYAYIDNFSQPIMFERSVRFGESSGSGPPSKFKGFSFSHLKTPEHFTTDDFPQLPAAPEPMRSVPEEPTPRHKPEMKDLVGMLLSDGFSPETRSTSNHSSQDINVDNPTHHVVDPAHDVVDPTHDVAGPAHDLGSVPTLCIANLPLGITDEEQTNLLEMLQHFAPVHLFKVEDGESSCTAWVKLETEEGCNLAQECYHDDQIIFPGHRLSVSIVCAEEAIPVPTMPTGPCSSQ